MAELKNFVDYYGNSIEDLVHATEDSHGLMCPEDKALLGTIEEGAEPNQNAFSAVKVGTATVSADNSTDTLELVAGTNVNITPSSDKITITATDTVYTHPDNHAATMITQDASHRFVTDIEKTNWNAVYDELAELTVNDIDEICGQVIEVATVDSGTF